VNKSGRFSVFQRSSSACYEVSKVQKFLEKKQVSVKENENMKRLLDHFQKDDQTYCKFLFRGSFRKF